ncbi:outer membrane protein [Vannielia litorea]|uniref:Outer membrane insertion C-terminal signal n=1 Tax=Vannielia litorea TaxID=1217970 RepID=A0A1N6FE68_9RHOB|nr:porin family protein [Vannielia litorea]SIN93568.1 outer membrane insertion C-terminal signal [Vannielia litorea]
MKTFIAAATLPALLAFPAFAGNLETPLADDVVTTPAPVVDLGRDWTGGYVGLSFGTGSGEIDGGGATNDFDVEDNYGLYGGYLWDNGNLVYGGELAYSSLGLNPDVGPDADADVWALKGRLGYDAGNFLPYATAGFANITSEGESGDGYVLGAGLEYAATDNIRVRGEYLNHQFDDFGDTGNDVKADTFSLGLSYNF